jgi:hypothetical protein
MRILISLLLWALLLSVCWPLALIAVVAWPILWLLSIPFRVVGAVVSAALALIKAVFFLPARMLGYRDAGH